MFVSRKLADKNFETQDGDRGGFTNNVLSPSALATLNSSSELPGALMIQRPGRYHSFIQLLGGLKLCPQGLEDKRSIVLRLWLQRYSWMKRAGFLCEEKRRLHRTYSPSTVCYGVVDHRFSQALNPLDLQEDETRFNRRWRRL